MVCPLNGTAVLKGLWTNIWVPQEEDQTEGSKTSEVQDEVLTTNKKRAVPYPVGGSRTTEPTERGQRQTDQGRCQHKKGDFVFLKISKGHTNIIIRGRSRLEMTGHGEGRGCPTE